MPAQTAFVQLAEPIRCTRRTNSKSAISILAKVLSRNTPALLTRMSTRPHALSARATIAETCSKSATSAGSADRRPAAGANLFHNPHGIVEVRPVLAEIIDDDVRSARRKSQSMRTSETGARAGDDGHSALKVDCHEDFPVQAPHSARRCFRDRLVRAALRLQYRAVRRSASSDQAAVRLRSPRPSRERSPKSANRRSTHAESCRAPSKRRYRCRRESPRGSPRRPIP